MCDPTRNVAQDFLDTLFFPDYCISIRQNNFSQGFFLLKRVELESQVKNLTFQINELAPRAQNEFTRMPICNYESNSRALRGNQII